VSAARRKLVVRLSRAIDWHKGQAIQAQGEADRHRLAVAELTNQVADLEVELDLFEEGATP
jgi:hypothetical protein